MSQDVANATAHQVVICHWDAQGLRFSRGLLAEDAILAIKDVFQHFRVAVADIGFINPVVSLSREEQNSHPFVGILKLIFADEAETFVAWLDGTQPRAICTSTKDLDVESRLENTLQRIENKRQSFQNVNTLLTGYYSDTSLSKFDAASEIDVSSADQHVAPKEAGDKGGNLVDGAITHDEDRPALDITPVLDALSDFNSKSDIVNCKDPRFLTSGEVVALGESIKQLEAQVAQFEKLKKVDDLACKLFPDVEPGEHVDGDRLTELFAVRARPADGSKPKEIDDKTKAGIDDLARAFRDADGTVEYHGVSVRVELNKSTKKPSPEGVLHTKKIRLRPEGTNNQSKGTFHVFPDLKFSIG